MTDTILEEPVSLVLERNIPVRMDWKGVRYYVDLTPVPPRALAYDRRRLTPLDRPSLGWNFRGSTAEGESHGFDVMALSSGQWLLTTMHDG